jgi:Dolichyl-phosphate-mannose-protein mannosyltransferase
VKKSARPSAVKAPPRASRSRGRAAFPTSGTPESKRSNHKFSGLRVLDSDLMALPLLLAVTVLVHAPALRAFFAQDDITFLSRARGLEPEMWTLVRFLSGALRWRVMNAFFGLHPLPYHALNLALHLGCVTLVYFAGRKLLGGRGAAFAAALLFGVSSIAFTPLHWATGMGEILVTLFALAALLTHRRARERESRGWAWLTAACVLGALLSKESAVVLPLILLVADSRLGDFAPRPRSLLPSALVTLGFVAAFVVSLDHAEYLGGEAYAMTLSPVFIAQNLATYLRWLIQPQVPVRDAIAAMRPDALLPGLAVAVSLAVALWVVRRSARRPEEVGGAWLLLFLAPVLPLTHHTYLYYLYLPSVGACWLVAGLAQRLVRRVGAPGLALAVIALVGCVAIEFNSVRARERAMTGDFPADRTVRESTMLAHAMATLDSVAPAPGISVGFVNPAPQRHSALAGPADAGYSYIPLESAFRDGEAIRLFHPGVRYLGFAGTIPPAWEHGQLFLYGNDGALRALGSGSAALAEVGYLALRYHEFARADSLLERSLALGDTLPAAVFGLVVTREQLGRRAESRGYGALFLRRWPDDERAAPVRAQLGLPPGR